MNEVWLRPNRRALGFGMILPAAVAVAGVALATGGVASWGAAGAVVGWLLAAVGFSLMAALAWQMRIPRVAFRSGELLFYLRFGEPIRVPIEVVECFFIGQGPAILPSGRNSGRQGVNVIVRLAEKAADWAEREVNPALGTWCQSYITIRGAWCEPLNERVVNGLNRRLAEATKPGMVS
jgi:hypothetical protein